MGSDTVAAFYEWGVILPERAPCRRLCDLGTNQRCGPVADRIVLFYSDIYAHRQREEPHV